MRLEGWFYEPLPFSESSLQVPIAFNEKFRGVRKEPAPNHRVFVAFAAKRWFHCGIIISNYNAIIMHHLTSWL